MGEDRRTRSFAQDAEPTRVDRLGRSLSLWRIRRALRHRPLAQVADVGCGYDARLAQSVFPAKAHVVLIDVAVDDRFRTDSRYSVFEGLLPSALASLSSDSFDAVVCNNVLEHLQDDVGALREMHRMLRPGGMLVANVPSWLGKWFLEIAAFRLSVAPREEMDDHKRYYDPKDLWPLLVQAGFSPSLITCRRHKLRLNTLAVCVKSPAR